MVNRSGGPIPAAFLRRAARKAAGRLPVTVAVLQDAEMARLHRRHLGRRGATDVLAFPPGDVAVAVGVARREACARGLDWRLELARYAVHGCLHLKGYRDARPGERGRMWRRQEGILASLGRPR